MHRISDKALTQEPSEPNVIGVVVLFALMGGAAAGNSAVLLYELTGGHALSGDYWLLFVCTSAAGHLVYPVLPWYFRMFVAPALRLGRSAAAPCSGSDSATLESTATYRGLAKCFGAVFCVLSLGLWLAATDVTLLDIFGPAEPDTPMVTPANCALIGGTTETRDGRLVCRI